VTQPVQRHLYREIGRRRKRAQCEHACQAEVRVQESAIETDPTELIEDEIKVATAAVIAKLEDTLDERAQFIVCG
jgi:DNA-binding protein YbaB